MYLCWSFGKLLDQFLHIILYCCSTNQQSIEHQGIYMSSRFQCYQEGLEHHGVLIIVFKALSYDQHNSCHHSTVNHLVQTSVHHSRTSQILLAYQAYIIIINIISLFIHYRILHYTYIHCIPVTAFFITVQQFLS